MPETDKYGKYLFDREPIDRSFVENPGINWAERIKHLQENYEAERQYLEDLEGDTVDDVEIEVEYLSESFLKLMEDHLNTKFVTIDEHPRWKEAMRRLGRL